MPLVFIVQLFLCVGNGVDDERKKQLREKLAMRAKKKEEEEVEPE
jgi:hypothetical protein